MKVYVRAAVSIKNLREQFAKDMDEDLFQQLVDLDPTADFAQGKPGKYCPWIFRQYNKGNLNVEADGQNLTDALEHFAKYGKRYSHTDLGQYKTVKEFLDDNHEVINRPLTEEEEKKALKKRAHNPSDADKKFLVEDDEWEVWTPITRAGSISLSREGGDKARWCTAAEGNDDYYWRRYTAQGPLYIFINKANRAEKYQTHFESGSYWYDRDDRSHGESAFNRFMAEHPIIAEYFDIVQVDGVSMRAGTITGYTEGATYIKIPDGATTITKRFPATVEEIVMPNTVTTIGERICNNCNNLVKITLSTNLQEIPTRTFEGCTSLETIDVPDSVTAYGDGAFRGCSSLRILNNSRNLKKVGNTCFEGCTQLDDFELPDSVEDLGNGCFNGVGFSGITLPASLTTLKGTFTGDNSIERVDLKNVTTISTNAFKDSSIADIDLSNVTKIGSNAFRQCNNLTSVILNPEGVDLGSAVFADNPNLTNINVPANSKLGYIVFDNCPQLTVRWNNEDMPYEFDNIGLLICDDSCTELINTNKGFIKIQTTSGVIYEVQ